MERVLAAGPIAYRDIELHGDPDLEHALRHYGVEPGDSTYRLIELPVASITDTAAMPHRLWDRGLIDVIRSGTELPPIVVFRNWRGPGWGLLDGVNRTNAFLACDVRVVRAYEVLQRPEP
jgi:hypothetical protein